MLFLAQIKFVITAEAGTHLPQEAPGGTVRRWVPAFAGMTVQIKATPL